MAGFGRHKVGHDTVETTLPFAHYLNANAAQAGHPRLAVLMQRKAWMAARSLCPGLSRAVAMTIEQRPYVSTCLRFAVAPRLTRFE
jgi:hypothetical protein